MAVGNYKKWDYARCKKLRVENRIINGKEYVCLVKSEDLGAYFKKKMQFSPRLQDIQEYDGCNAWVYEIRDNRIKDCDVFITKDNAREILKEGKKNNAEVRHMFPRDKSSEVRYYIPAMFWKEIKKDLNDGYETTKVHNFDIKHQRILMKKDAPLKDLSDKIRHKEDLANERITENMSYDRYK